MPPTARQCCCIPLHEKNGVNFQCQWKRGREGEGFFLAACHLHRLQSVLQWNKIASKFTSNCDWISPGECDHRAGVCPKLGWRCNGQTDRPTWIDGPCQRIGPSFSWWRNSLAWKIIAAYPKYWPIFILLPAAKPSRSSTCTFHLLLLWFVQSKPKQPL